LEQIVDLEDDELLLICGSFFIMTDVRQFFGYHDVDIDDI
jgi:hypothetical protein